MLLFDIAIGKPNREDDGVRRINETEPKYY
jgi:hypothetical protein